MKSELLYIIGRGAVQNSVLRDRLLDTNTECPFNLKDDEWFCAIETPLSDEEVKRRFDLYHMIDTENTVVAYGSILRHVLHEFLRTVEELDNSSYCNTILVWKDCTLGVTHTYLIPGVIARRFEGMLYRDKYSVKDTIALMDALTPFHYTDNNNVNTELLYPFKRTKLQSAPLWVNHIVSIVETNEDTTVTHLV